MIDVYHDVYHGCIISIMICIMSIMSIMMCIMDVS